MQIGIVGLGRMGGNMATRLLRDQHQVFGFDPDAAVLAELEAQGRYWQNLSRRSRQRP